MAIIKKTIWTAKCDKCRKEFGENALFPFATSLKKLREGLEDEAWVRKQGKVLCPDCSGEWNEDGTPRNP